MVLSFPQRLALLGVALLAIMLANAQALQRQARSPQDAGNEEGDEGVTLHFYTPTPSFTIPPWYTRTSSASEPSQSVSFSLGDVGSMVVCGQSNITWMMNDYTFYRMAIAAMPVSSDAQPTLVTIMDGGLGIGYYNWSPVNVSPGEYVLEVSIPNAGALYYSKTFLVHDSSDHSCLATVSSTASSAPTGSPGTATSPSAVSVSSSAGAGAGGVFGTSVVSAASGGSSMSGGGIAGIVIGVLAFVGALIAIFIYLLRRRSGRSTGSGSARANLFEKGRPKGAFSIISRGASFSSTHGSSARGLGNTALGNSAQYRLNDPSRSDVGHDVGLGISYDDFPSPSMVGEKPLSHAPIDVGVAAPALAHRSPYKHRDSVGSIGSTTAAGSPGGAIYREHSRHQSLPYTSDPFNPDPPSGRQSSDYQGQVPVALFSPSSATSTPRTYGSPGVPQDISISSSTFLDFTDGSELATPIGVVASPTASRRAPPAPPTTAPANTQAGVKRTRSASARKPVPVYEPSVHDEELELVEPSSPRSPSAPYYNNMLGEPSRTSFGQASSTGNDWSSAAAHSHSPAESSKSHLSRGSGHSLPGLTTRGDVPELNHKSSFGPGDRQMHVIMPDPPSRLMQ